MTINEAMRTYRLPNTTTPEFTSDDHSCEGEIRLKAASDPIFEDDGHAISWAIAN